jgi:hypothetical protein
MTPLSPRRPTTANYTFLLSVLIAAESKRGWRTNERVVAALGQPAVGINVFGSVPRGNLGG